MPRSPRTTLIISVATAASCAVVGGLIGRDAIAGGAGAGDPLPLDTTDADFFQRGTQPVMDDVDPVITAQQCQICHGNYDEEYEPFTTWAASMPGQSARDPMFWAELEVANNDAEGAGQFCIRCHAPTAFLAGRDAPDGSEFTLEDFEGVTCNVCHRTLDQDFKEGISPEIDAGILESLANNFDYTDDGLIPPEPSNARYVIDPTDSRRGPIAVDDIPFNPHLGNPQPEIIESPHHKTSELCWGCHDVSNPLTIRLEDGTYVLNDLDEPHPTGLQSDMFPLHRTYREWQNSYYFTQGGVQHDGRFGGNHPTGIMNVCQDCHFPDYEGFGCGLEGFPLRPDVPQHSFVGSNTWVIGAIRNLFEDFETGLSEASENAARARNVDMLEKASDLELDQEQSLLVARVVNQGGHKLPTGFPDGRRIWVNVKFFDVDDNLLAEHGRYDFEEATLFGDDTTVFECILGISEDQAQDVGLPAGPTFHFALANVIEKDNRIPPTGFSLTIAERDQSLPVGETYFNGQHWHDSKYHIPSRSKRAVVTVYYQLTSREFVEFLAEKGGERGAIALEQWELEGKSQPVVMDSNEIELRNPADVNQDGSVDLDDLLLVLSLWGNCPPPPLVCPPDINNDGLIGFEDVLGVLSNWGL